jgi:hypothetical protein
MRHPATALGRDEKPGRTGVAKDHIRSVDRLRHLILQNAGDRVPAETPVAMAPGRG